ncbi:MAG: hypothetical protein IJS65_06115 [Clostridia bacterium]|nr:hypothetical protein [Clostridia bacterium]
MEYRRISKMTRAERAKQFAPFSPLAGLSLALSARENALLYSKELYLPDDTPVVLPPPLPDGLLAEDRAAFLPRAPKSEH